MASSKFEKSPELKKVFNEQLALWKSRNGSGIAELAERCGVTSSYLSHIGRYGRIPSKPVMILLAFNFGLENPEAFFALAGSGERWPYEAGLSLARRDAEKSGFLNVSIDMKGFTEEIRSIVKSEVQPRSLASLTGGGPLRLGYNRYQVALVSSKKSVSGDFGGFFAELCKHLSMTMRCKIIPQGVNRIEYLSMFERGELDAFGPIFTNLREHRALFTKPFCSLGMSALVRKRRCDSLPKLGVPKTIDELIEKDYVIAVMRNGGSHLYANTRLEKSDEELIICDNIDEAVERLILSNIPRPAHILIEATTNAYAHKNGMPKDLDVAFGEKGNLLSQAKTSIAVRPDWPELVTMIDQSIEYLSRTGTLEELFARYLPEMPSGVMEVAEGF